MESNSNVKCDLDSNSLQTNSYDTF